MNEMHEQSKSLQVEVFSLGDFQTNCYLLYESGGVDCWIIDCGQRPGDLFDRIQTLGLQPQQVLLTHGHIDHIAGLHDCRRIWPNMPILIHADEEHFLTDPMLNLSGLFAMPIVQPPATETFKHGDAFDIAGRQFEVRLTPGHSPGNVAFIQHDENVALVGDTLFAGSIGRYDFPTSDGRALLRSIREQLLTLPDTMRVLPGHGPETTIGHERATNPYILNQPSDML